jgi:thiamine-monophosphate kinase
MVMERNSKKKSERDIIEHISNLQGLQSDTNVIKGIGDDCAVLRKDQKSCFLVTTDTLVADVHFDLAWHPPFLLGRKTAAVNLSDIAAMGGQPRYAFLNVAFPGSVPVWLDDFLAGFHEMLQEYDTLLVGGDTVKSPNDLSITVTIIGEADEDVICYRSGAVIGDLVFVSGFLGDAAAGLDLYRSGFSADSSSQWQQLVKAHLDPLPQVKLGKILAESGLVHAMIDISDGLASDLAHICTESRTGAEVFKKALPVSDQLRAAAEKLKSPIFDWVLKGGEDYQLLFTASPDHEQDLRQLVAREAERKISAVGRIVEGRKVYFCNGKKRHEISYQGYDHFIG